MIRSRLAVSALALGLAMTTVILIIHFLGEPIAMAIGLVVMGAVMFLLVSVPIIALVSFFSRPTHMPRVKHFWLVFSDMFTYKRRPFMLDRRQKREVRACADKWRQVFFSTAPADREECLQAVERLYVEQGLAAPRVLWVSSPLQAAAALMLLQMEGEPGYSPIVNSRYPFHIGDNLHLAGSTQDALFGYHALNYAHEDLCRMFFIRNNVVFKLYRDLHTNPSAVWAACLQVRKEMQDQIPELMSAMSLFVQDESGGSISQEWMDAFEKSLRPAALRSFTYGSWSMGRHSAPEALEYEIAYRWRARELSVDFGLSAGTEAIAGAQATLARNCGWCLPLERVVILTEPATVIRTDYKGRLHAKGRPAVEFCDGWAVHAVRGVLAPAHWAEEAYERWKLEWLMITDNQEERRALMETIDYGRVLRQSKNHRLIHQDGDMSLYMLGNWEDEDFLSNRDVEPVVLLEAHNLSTGSSRVLRVPPDMDTCRQAQQWALNGGKYTPAV